MMLNSELETWENIIKREENYEWRTITEKTEVYKNISDYLGYIKKLFSISFMLPVKYATGERSFGGLK